MSKKSKFVQTAPEKAPTTGSFTIAPPKETALAFEIAGRSYIQNAFSQKAIEEMLRKHMGLTVQREKKNPRQVIERAIIRNVDGVVCAPPVSIKSAMLTASGQLKTFEKKKTQLKTSLFIVGESLPVVFEKMIPRLDMVRTSGQSRTPDVRFRPEFVDWKIRLVILYSETLLQPQSISDLLFRAGNVGIGEWRPEKNGTHGTFKVLRQIVDSKEVAEVLKECAVPLKTPEIPEWALDLNIDMTLLAKMFSPAGDGEGEDDDESVEVKKKNVV